MDDPLGQWFPTTALRTTSAPWADLKRSKKEFSYFTAKNEISFPNIGGFLNIFLSGVPRLSKGGETLP